MRAGYGALRDAGTTWVQIKKSLDSTNSAMRPEMTVTTLPNGKTRMYVAEGAFGAFVSCAERFFPAFPQRRHDHSQPNVHSR